MDTIDSLHDIDLSYHCVYSLCKLGEMTREGFGETPITLTDRRLLDLADVICGHEKYTTAHEALCAMAATICCLTAKVITMSIDALGKKPRTSFDPSNN
jgi:hypothetical protein